MKQRRLVSIRRQVAPEQRAEYDAWWSRLRTAAEARGAHAWRFTAADQPTTSLEFLEFAAGADPRQAPEVADLLRQLDPRLHATPEEWVEG